VNKLLSAHGLCLYISFSFCTVTISVPTQISYCNKLFYLIHHLNTAATKAVVTLFALIQNCRRVIYTKVSVTIFLISTASDHIIKVLAPISWINNSSHQIFQCRFNGLVPVNVMVFMTNRLLHSLQIHVMRNKCQNKMRCCFA
jgi:hypothetical protein